MMYRNGLIRATPCSQPGASVIGSRIPDSSTSGTMTELSIGANASSLLTVRAVAYDTEARPTATRTMKPRLMNTALTGARSPNAMPTSTRITACTPRTRGSRSTRPLITASRDTGGTRDRSIPPPAARVAPNPLLHPPPPARDDGEPDEHRAEQPELDQQPGHEEPVRLGV